MPNIYYYAPCNKVPSGGTRVTYRHVDLLNAAGFSAFVLHEKKHYRARWFKNNTPIHYVRNLKKAKFSPDDFLVMPELFGPSPFKNIASKRHIIFNQNAYFSFRGGYTFDTEDLSCAHQSPELIATMCISKDTQQYLNYAFPEARTVLIPPSINQTLFYFIQNKKKQIAIMPRKLPKHALQVINLLKQHQTFKEYRLAIIDNIAEAQAAEILRDSLFFLSFSHQEGFGLPPAEAMACGCITIGFHGQGGKEFLLPEYSFPIEMGNIVAFAKTTETVINEYQQNPASLDKMRKTAAEFITQQYSVEHEKKALINFWQQMLRNVSNDA